MRSFRNLSLAKKLYGITGVPVAFLVVLAALVVTGSGASLPHTLVIALTIAGVAFSASAAVLTARQQQRSVRQIIDRMSAVEKAAKENLMAGLNALSTGDLTVRLTPGTAPNTDFSADEFGRIMRQTESMRNAIIEAYGAYNLTVDTLSSLIGEVRQTAGSVGEASHQMSSTSEEAGKASGEIALAIGEVAEGTERQVQLVAETRRIVGEVAAAVTECAVHAEQTADLTSRARATAQRGVGAAGEATDAMAAVRDSSAAVTDAIRELAGKSEQIGAIVQTITGIAEQTNLLALNAAIEAARAGDQGRGFAVVADEVRKLAEESARATSEIAELIGSIQAQTASAVRVVEDGTKRTTDGAEVVEQTRAALLEIGESVEEIGERVEQIAAAAQQVTASAGSMESSIGEVVSVVEGSSASTEQISASTEETSASAEEIAASAHELAGSAKLLSRLVGRFHVDENGGNSAARVLASALDAHRAWNTRLQQAIDTGTSATPVEEASLDDRCSFGKWLHGPGSFQDREPERWQHLHDLHEQFHREAGEILRLATSGDSRRASDHLGSAAFRELRAKLERALQADDRTAA